MNFNALSTALLLTPLFATQLCFANLFNQGPFTENPDGATRKAATVYLPNQYKMKAQWPLVVLLHGYSGTADKEDLYMGLRYRVSLHGFILVTPEGQKDSKGNPFWNATDACCDLDHQGVDDVKYLTELLKKIQVEYHVDPARIYLIGHSNGGFMANRLACEKGELFAGIASLAGVGFKDLALCHSAEPVSMLHIQAKDDPTIKYEGAPEYPGAEETANRWAARNNCPNSPERGPDLRLTLSIPGPGKDAHSLYWKNCQQGTEVALWTIKPYQSTYHHPHIPLLSFDFTDQVLNFLLSHHR